MQRSQLLRSSHESASPRPSRAASRAMSRSTPCSVIRMRPSGGSTISDSRSMRPACSSQPAPVPPVASITARCARRLSAHSSSVSRSSGVVVELFHRPCRSGSPHGVRGTAEPSDSMRSGTHCPAAGAATARAATSTAPAPTVQRVFIRIRAPPRPTVVAPAARRSCVAGRLGRLLLVLGPRYPPGPRPEPPLANAPAAHHDGHGRPGRVYLHPVQPACRSQPDRARRVPAPHRRTGRPPAYAPSTRPGG